MWYWGAVLWLGMNFLSFLIVVNLLSPNMKSTSTAMLYIICLYVLLMAQSPLIFFLFNYGT